jgi:hypothetical protein
MYLVYLAAEDNPRQGEIKYEYADLGSALLKAQNLAKELQVTILVLGQAEDGSLNYQQKIDPPGVYEFVQSRHDFYGEAAETFYLRGADGAVSLTRTKREGWVECGIHSRNPRQPNHQMQGCGFIKGGQCYYTEAGLPDYQSGLSKEAQTYQIEAFLERFYKQNFRLDLS